MNVGGVEPVPMPSVAMRDGEQAALELGRCETVQDCDRLLEQWRARWFWRRPFVRLILGKEMARVRRQIRGGA